MFSLVSFGNVRLLFPQGCIRSVASSADVDRSSADKWSIGHCQVGHDSIPIYELSDDLFVKSATQIKEDVSRKDFCLLFRADGCSELHEGGFGLCCEKIESLDVSDSSLIRGEIPEWMCDDTLGLRNIYSMNGIMVLGCDASLLSYSIDKVVVRSSL